MRLADLLVDLAAVASASRSVASKHVVLRAGQIDRYKKTSSIVTTFRTEKNADQPTGKPDASAEQRPADEREHPSSSVVEEASVPMKDEGVRFGEVTVEGVEEVISQEEVQKPAVTVGREFKPAPWATRVGVTRQSTQARPPVAPGLKREPVQILFVAESDRESSTLNQVDVGVFRTRRGQEVVGRPAVEEVVREREVNEEKSVGGKEAVEKAKPAAPEPVKPVETAAREDAEMIAELAGASTPKYELRESRVPSSRIGRLWNYGGLAAGMFAGAIGEGLSRAVGGGSSSGGSVMLSPANMERLVSKLSRMRGAALKMGQMMSFQDAKMLPGPIQEVLQRVQDRADYMPAWQRDRVLTANLGPEWRDLFSEFEEKPIAAASIGQVHRATLKSTGSRVAVKIQFPGVADSINSDLDNLSVLLAAANLLPKGLYLNKTIDNARTELAWECDYEREAECAARYRELLAGGPDEAVFAVPQIYPEASGKHVLTMEFMDGVGVTRINSFAQEQRDWIGTQILRLCLREITEFHFMQTDPNWTNFLYNASKDRLELLDFGASREYPEEFISKYIALLKASSRSDRDCVKELSEELGYLTGHESKAMLDAHTTSVMTLAEPFLQSAPEVYDFRDQTITERVKAQIPVMIHERLAPPPEETYSLHRKLSGAFLLCARLGSRVRCRELFEQALVKVEALRAAK
ncbi:ABC1 family-domain-containing protein [Immersiella caudata]|uniref:ABC1 family-domain-containing protein n=1 Tax=Immersiella caudata TaxID=314043 RepID=A0AA40C5S2_9PEZI|nr:ABC1 family-domain-containing protein [Immersiella caudata]